MSDDQALSSFADKWRARWPEWRVAEAFIPQVERERALAWFALRQELTDAAWSGSDPAPGEAKLAWWAEELDGWSRGRRRHPLGVALQHLPVRWELLVACLPALRASREREGDTARAIDVLEPFAEAVAGIAATLYASRTPAPARSVVIGLLAERLLVQGDAAVPLQAARRFESRQGETGRGADPGDHAVARAWADELLQAWPPPHDGSIAGRIHAALLRDRLRAFSGGTAPARPLPPWRTLFSAWRAARRGVVPDAG